MLQQAGLAELGPVLKNFRMWKLQRYRAAWIAAQTYWTSERMLRVSGDQNTYQFLQVNQMQFNEYGQPILVNMLGNIDVEIKVDEGPDTETVMGDVFDLLMALAQNNVPVPPAVIIEASYLPLSEKQKLTQMINAPPSPQQQMASALQMQGAQATIAKTQAEAQKLTAEAGKAQTASQLNMAKVQTEGMPDGPPPPKSPLDIAQQMADINETNATAMHKRASATNLYHSAAISPLQFLADHAQRNADRILQSQHQNADRLAQGLHANADRITDTQHKNADRQVDREAVQVKSNATPE
jgi:hypothetical protein